MAISGTTGSVILQASSANNYICKSEQLYPINQHKDMAAENNSIF